MDLAYFDTEEFYTALQRFFKDLNIPVNYFTQAPTTAEELLKNTYKPNSPAHQLMGDIYFLGMVDDAAFKNSRSEKDLEGIKEERKDYDGILIFGVELNKRENNLLPTRTQFAEITRAFNREYHYTPVVVVFKYAKYISFASAQRLKYSQEWREGEKAGKVSLLKDIDFSSPHTGHLKILQSLAIERAGKNAVNSFARLYEYWQKVFSVSILNKQFYSELADWYFWAVKKVAFPDDVEKDEDVRNATSVIRLITRLIFIWFVKEKGLIPDELFDQNHLKGILNYSDKTGSTYYKAILQNLFFATLNTEMNKDKPNNRKFVNRQYGIHDFYRYARFFTDTGKALALFENIPFLNGGLFECLDKNVGGDNEVRIDCFSERPVNETRLKVPDELFFSPEKSVDLNEAYGTKNKSYTVRGLINILNSYKFTITENTPIEEEIALDPELLGKVFENLLASYNPETQTTARKQTGSYYTPREIVNYMVDESLLAYLSNTWTSDSDRENRLRHLFSYTEEAHKFTEQETALLIDAIDNIKILDPACGSGAFPMGILHKLVDILGKLDPDNQRWKQKQINKVLEIPDTTVREKLLEDIEQSFTNNELDYGRKLYLIENCIYGVDIQPIACQIAKLRFFISLVVDQKVDPAKQNIGVRPLPNLETKFVAANTLIGIEKPAQVSFRNPEIDRKEEELKKVRERHFTARTPQTKEKYRKEDERLRAEISGLLKRDGWPPGITEKLVHWDPYDQNASADFFDSEWMFGIIGGFDVVIANPPYGGKLSVKEKGDFKKLYADVHMRTSDTFNYFIAIAFQRLVTIYGVTTYIVPNNLLFQTEYEKTRRLLIEKNQVIAAINLGDGVFESATVPSCIFIAKRIVKPQYKEFGFADLRDFQTSQINYGEYLKQQKVQQILHVPALVFGVSDNDFDILKKVEEKSYTIDKIASEVASGISTGGDKIFRVHQSTAQSLQLESNLLKPVLVGGEIDKYRINDTKHVILYTDRTLQINKYHYLQNYLNQFKEKLQTRSETKSGVLPWFALGRQRYPTLFTEPKIIMRQTADNIRAMYDDKGYFVLNSILVFKINPEYSISYKFALAILNSKANQFAYRNFTQEKGRTFAEVKPKNVRKLFIPKAGPEEQKPFIDIVDNILAITKSSDYLENPAKKEEVKEYEKQIDQMVYKLYALTEEEIKIVEESCK